MDTVKEDPDARPKRLAVLAGFGMVVATGFATIAAMAVNSDRQPVASPDVVAGTSSSPQRTDRVTSVPGRPGERPDPALTSGSASPSVTISAVPPDASPPADPTSSESRTRGGGRSGDGGGSGEPGGGTGETPGGGGDNPGGDEPGDTPPPSSAPPTTSPSEPSPPDTSTPTPTVPSKPSDPVSTSASPSATTWWMPSRTTASSEQV